MWIYVLATVGLLLTGVVVYDIFQRKHAILRNFPIVGHFRYWLEAVGPELRQYIVTDNDEERPFSRDQRRWIYASSKRANNYFGFGTDNHLDDGRDYIIIKQSGLPLRTPHSGEEGYDEMHPLPAAKVLGGFRGRAKAFRPPSVVNVSAMSFGSLSPNAIAAINEGARIAGCMHNTGEGGISPYHQRGGDLVWQIGTGYFGARELDGTFSIQRVKEQVAANPVRALELKLSQGAKPGMGGILPAAKITPEISRIRGVPMGRDCISPPYHTAFRDPDSLLDFVEEVAAETGVPVGIKSAVGTSTFWHELARLMATTGRGVDFITIDGGEGGTGAGPLAFTDHVALPFKVGFTRVYRMFAEQGLHEKVVFIGSGRLGFPAEGLFAMGLGCDMVNVAREAMMAIGCIQAQRCHTGHCPTGIATQNRWLVRGLDPTLKAARLANYVATFRKELLELSHACGEPHPALLTSDNFEVLQGNFTSTPAHELFHYETSWGRPSADDREEIRRIMENGAMRPAGLEVA